jgi:putative ABC transport system substrate-binding protein
MITKDGGLLAHGPNLVVGSRRGGVWNKAPKGAKPSDLPVEQPSRAAWTVNLKTAKALGLTILQSVLMRVDEAIR